jgi:hypothetical protein
MHTREATFFKVAPQESCGGKSQVSGERSQDIRACNG